MTVKINYLKSATSKNDSNLVLFVDEKLNIKNIQKYLSNSEFSYINDILVYKFREQVGYKMAEIIKNNLKFNNIEDIDIVVPIPLTSIVSANVISNVLNKYNFSRL